jgi:hypothetical protein
MTTPAERLLEKNRRYQLAEYATHLELGGKGGANNKALLKLLRVLTLEGIFHENSKVQDAIQRAGLQLKMQKELKGILSISADAEAGFAQMHGYSDFFQRYIEAVAQVEGVSFTELQAQVDSIIAENLATVVFDELQVRDDDKLESAQKMQPDFAPSFVGETLEEARRKKEEIQDRDAIRRLETAAGLANTLYGKLEDFSGSKQDLINIFATRLHFFENRTDMNTAQALDALLAEISTSTSPRPK